jgi:hypothetical protein
MQKKRRQSNLTFILTIIISTAFLLPTIGSAEEARLATGQTVYVPIYSHIYSGVKARPFDLAATLSIRNTNLKSAIELISVKYFDSEGKLVKDYLEKPIDINALATTRYIITEDDRAGGSGANFIVIWKSERPVNPPVIEGVMIGTHSGQGISFVSRGRVIKEDR